MLSHEVKAGTCKIYSPRENEYWYCRRCLNRDASGELCQVAIECHIVKIKKLVHVKFHWDEDKYSNVFTIDKKVSRSRQAKSCHQSSITNCILTFTQFLHPYFRPVTRDPCTTVCRHICIVREYKFNEAYVNLNYHANCTDAYLSSESSSWQQLHASSTLANGAVLGPILDNVGYPYYLLKSTRTS